jgi:mercuric ion transport protein
MKSGMGAVFAAIVASGCCLGPVLFTAIGSGALAAASTKLAVVRPVFLGAALALLGGAFYRTYGSRHDGGPACIDGSCPPHANGRARVVLWITAIVVIVFAAFPYYAEYLF